MIVVVIIAKNIAVISRNVAELIVFGRIKIRVGSGYAHSMAVLIGLSWFGLGIRVSTNTEWAAFNEKRAATHSLGVCT